MSIDFFKWGTDERVHASVPGRWSSHPEPLRGVPNPQPTIVPAPGTATITPGYTPFTLVYDPRLIQRQHDVPVTESGEEVAVAILRAGEAFAFTDSSYGHPSWGQPDLRLDRGTYRVRVRVQGSSVSRERAFRLEYLSDDFVRFHLTPT